MELVQTSNRVNIVELSKEQFTQFHKVRSRISHIFGSHHLFVRNRQKYLVKQLPFNCKFGSTRQCIPSFQAYCFVPQNSPTITYLFPLIGEPLTIASLHRYQTDKQINRLVQRHQGIQNTLWEVIKTILRATELGRVKDIILQSLRVYDGLLYYVYDSWMHDSRDVVKQNPQELQNYYFSQADLKQIQERRSIQGYTSRKNSVLFRIALLVLNLGTPQLKLRNYEFAGLFIQWKNIQQRIDVFKNKYNSHGLAAFLEKILIKGQDLKMQDLWNLIGPIKAQKQNLIVSTQNHRPSLQIRKKHGTASKKQNNTASKNKNRQITIIDTKIRPNCLNQSVSILNENSQNMNRSNLSVLNQSLVIYNSENVTVQYKPKLKIKGSQRKAQQANNKGIKQSQMCQPFDIKKRLCQYNHDSISRLTAFLGLDQYVPNSGYQHQIINAIENVDIKSNWIRKEYPNGSLYFGQLDKNQEREGKGLYLFQSDDFYYGDWRSNKIQGYGYYVFKSGEAYRGFFENGKKHGHGVFKYNDKRVFEGTWSNNTKFGLGTIIFPNQVTFMGLFSPNRSSTDGLFINNLTGIQWNGTLQDYIWSDHENQKNRQILGKKRKSKLKNCSVERFCEFTTKYGDTYQGQSLDGKKNGFGVFKSSGETYQGHWKNDMQHGQGILFVQNLFQISGKWEDGLFVEYKIDEFK